MSILAKTPLVHRDQRARDDWGWNPEFDLSKAAADMIARARKEGDG
jgi:nucleoside-diphosphate-sugar epimerase